MLPLRATATSVGSGSPKWTTSIAIDARSILLTRFSPPSVPNTPGVGTSVRYEGLAPVMQGETYGFVQSVEEQRDDAGRRTPENDARGLVRLPKQRSSGIVLVSLPIR